MDREGWFNNLFFCSYGMRNNYLTYRDVVFINKRFIKTRFSRCLLMFCGVSSAGKSVLFAFTFLQKEDEESFDYAVEHFNKALVVDCAPKVIILERNSQLKGAFMKLSTPCPLLYCSNHY